MTKLKRLGSFAICLALLMGYITSAAAQKPQEDFDKLLEKFLTDEQKFESQWARGKDVPQLIEKLVAYREKHGPSPNIDYMLATSYCRIDRTRIQGVRLFRWMLNYYRFDASSRRLLKQALDSFLIPSRKGGLGIDFQKRSRGWVVAGPARVKAFFNRGLLPFKSPLEISAETATVDSVRETYARYRPTKNELLTALYLAAGRKDPEGVRVLKFLLDQESIPGTDRARLLHRAADDGSAASVSLLITFNVDLKESVDSSSVFTVGEQALITAARRNDAEAVNILQILYRNKIDLNAVSSIDGDMALLAATRTGTIGSVRFLLESGAKSNVHFGKSLRHVDFEFETGAAGIVKVLGIGSEIDPAELFEADSTPLMFAAGRGDSDGPMMIRLLLEHGARRDGLHATKALLNAATAGNIQNLTELLEAGLPVNGQNEFGATALMIAAEYGETDVVVFLMGRGADRQIKNRAGHSALMRATYYGYSEIQVLLR